MGPWPQVRAAVHRLRFLRYVTIWPLIVAYERKCRRSLRWRLAESHLGTVFFSVLAISVIGAAAVVTTALVQNPVRREPATEAQIVAQMLADLNWTADPVPDWTSPLLSGIATGKVGPNSFNRDVNIFADVGKRFANIRTISVVGPDQTVLASSDPTLLGRGAIQIGPAALGVARSALDGSTSTSRNSVMQRPGRSLVTGAYPMRNAAGEVVAAVVVDKRQRTLPGGNDLLLLGMSYVGQIGLVIALLVGIPAIPVGVVIGIRRARGISKPIRELAGCAEAFAEGDLSTRVDVQGEDEIADLGKRFNEMADRLQATMVLEAASRARAEQLLAANRDLVANVSHELRTPVALVRGHLEALDAEPARVEEYTRIALRETDRLERLVADLFHLTRVESQDIALEREPFDAGAAVREAVESLAEPARREAGITMLAEVGAGDLRCVGDRARLVQVLQNLIRNAVRFTPEGGIILASAQDDGDRVTVMVRDTGVGIAPDDLPHVFDRFYRGEQSRNRAAGGAGLGLAIAKQLIEAMSGEISVESELDEGSVFTIRLPRIQVPTTAGTNGAASNGAKAALVAAR